MYVYAFGSNKFSQLAQTSELKETHVPTEIKSLRGANITKVACGFFHTLLLIQNKVYSFGQNDYLALGRDNAPHEVLEVPLKDDIIDISCGKSHSAALTVNGILYAWGTIEEKVKVLTNKEPIEIAQDIICIQSIKNGILLVDKYGNIKSFGFDRSQNETSNDNNDSSNMLRTVIEHNENLPIFNKIKVGSKHFFVFDDHKLYGWGKNKFGQLGNGKKEKYANFQSININDVKDVDGGFLHTLFLKKDGSLYVSGCNEYFSFTCFKNGEVSTPIFIMDGIEMIACNKLVHFVVKKNAIYSWGINMFGELGQIYRKVIEPKKMGFKFGKILGIYPGLCHTIVVTEDEHRNKFLGFFYKIFSKILSLQKIIKF
ncbi:Ultraviolet-B receptor uvr8 [Conglomerata obtusa]